MVTLDATVVNVAQRTFAGEFTSTPAVDAWTVTAYTLALAVVIPLTGWAANWLGTKRLALGSVTLFTVGSLLCALASNISVLVAFRALQGLGGGMLMPLQLIILARAAGPERFGRVLTISMVPVLLAPIGGPILGGWLIDSFGWQWIFLINVPIGVLTLLLAGAVLPQHIPSPTESPDVVGMLLLSPGMVLLIYGVSVMPERGTVADHHVWVPTTSGLILIGAFVMHALPRAEGALINVRCSKFGRSGRPMLSGSCSPLRLSAVACCFLGTSSRRSQARPLIGLLLIPQTLAAAAVMPVAGRLMERWSPRSVVLIGTVLALTGMACLSTASACTTRTCRCY